MRLINKTVAAAVIAALSLTVNGHLKMPLAFTIPTTASRQKLRPKSKTNPKFKPKPRPGTPFKRMFPN